MRIVLKAYHVLYVMLVFEWTFGIVI